MRARAHCDRYMEIYNLVFMEYDLRPGNKLEPLPAQNVDTGLGLERGECVLQGVDSVFDTDGFRRSWTGSRPSRASPTGTASLTKAHRVLADHGARCSFLIAEGVGRRTRAEATSAAVCSAARSSRRSGSGSTASTGSPASSIDQMGDAYPELREHAAEIERVVRARRSVSRETLARGMKEFEELAGREAISGEDAFLLAATYGFPIELTQELAEERGQAVDVDGFRELMEEHREISRAGGEKSDLQRAAEFARRPASRAEFVGYEKTDVLTQLGALEDLGDGMFLGKLARVAVLRRRAAAR